MKKKKKPDGKPALDLIEEAVHLLRGAPLGAHLCYYIGSIPFVLGLLYFWSDMSRGAYAYDRIAGTSLELALLFIWMKCWQSAAAAKLMAFLSASEEPRWTAGRVSRLVVTQAALQSTALIARPVALLITLPYAWVRAFYENAVILGDGGDAGLGELGGKARRLAALWPRQNIVMLLWLFFFGSVVWLNVFVLMVSAPQLLRIFTGIETSFTQNILSTVFNTTFLAVSVGITYLCVNPLTKAVYVLRCFYGESLHSGDDLKLGMRRAVAAATAAAMALLLLCAPEARADSPQTPPPAASVKPAALDDSITRVLKRDEFAWRLPRQAAPEASQNFLTRFFDDIGRWISKTFDSMMKGLGRMLEKWFRARPRDDSERSGPSFANLGMLLHILIWVICVVAVLLLLWLLWNNRHGFRRRGRVQAQAITVVPDLKSEDVVASQLPEDEWLRMAREMMAKGEYRLAIRALYLATLAHLGLRELISIARHKSNRDYQRELRRRAGGKGELVNAFGESVSIFEGVWYGSHATTEDIIREFSANMERIKVA